jgi:hypothetical protein
VKIDAFKNSQFAKQRISLINTRSQQRNLFIFTNPEEL